MAKWTVRLARAGGKACAHSACACSDRRPAYGVRRRWPPGRRCLHGAAAFALISSLIFCNAPSSAASESEDVTTALTLAGFLRAARTVISENQSLINDPEAGDKGLTGAVVLEKAKAKFREASGKDPQSVDSNSREGRLLSSQMAAVVEVMDENQTTINRKGLGFKGFVPAVFARLVNERFRAKAGQEADIKVTAPRRLIRNRKALPDSWENGIIEEKLVLPDWPKNQMYTAETEKKGRTAFRVLLPEYYGQGCLKCHGGPKGDIDVTGYPKEGGQLGELGGVISISLFR